jgi:lipopolysaccharide transport system ATP-binding protein/teichoic acid transport system ATP-binding protein
MAVLTASDYAVRASGLRKEYRLGESRNLQATLTSLLRGAANRGRARFEALAGVDFELARGETHGVVGVNGSGKSTLLQVLAGTIVPSGGEMRVRGRVVPLLGVGQGFHPELTGRENVTLFAASLGIKRSTIESRMAAVADFAELGDRMDTPIKRFSSGMISRLSFAIAMQLPGDIYAFDEVLAVVDGEFQARCVHAIRELQQSGRTVIFVSHDSELVGDVCSSVLWLEKGAVRGHGPAASVLEEYQQVHRPVES